LHSNELTGAGPGICSIVAGIATGSFTPNVNWTDPSQCPACLNTFTVPNEINCTGANAVSSAATIGASIATAALVVASLVALL
jgi:hypothetical protein